MKWLTKRPERPIFITALLLFFSSLSYASNLSHSWQSPNYIEDAFVEIAFKREYERGNFRLNKWRKPIYYRIHYAYMKGPYTPAETLMKAHLSDLSHITGLKISPAGNHKSNLNIYFTKDRYYADVIRKYSHSQQVEAVKHSNCMGTYHTNKNGEIDRATVVIPLDHVLKKGLLPACVVEETTQVLGLPNDSDWVNPSIANDKSLYDLLTGLDYVMLKVLYHPSLKPGMTRNQSRPLIRKILKRYQKQGIIKNAARYVKQTQLARMVE